MLRKIEDFSELGRNKQLQLHPKRLIMYSELSDQIMHHLSAPFELRGGGGSRVTSVRSFCDSIRREEILNERLKNNSCYFKRSYISFFRNTILRQNAAAK